MEGGKRWHSLGTPKNKKFPINFKKPVGMGWELSQMKGKKHQDDSNKKTTKVPFALCTFGESVPTIEVPSFGS